MSDDDNEVLKALRSPVLAEMPEELKKTKRNLLASSSVIIFAKLSGIKITEAGFLGVRFTSPDQFWLDSALLCVSAYLLSQFCWRAFDYLFETRIRVTGTRLSHVTVAKSAYSGADYPNDPRQSSLYHWWADEASDVGVLGDTIAKIEETAQKLEDLAKSPAAEGWKNINHVNNGVSLIRTSATQLRRQLETLTGALNSKRIPISLERFDKWFGCFSKSQVYRLLLLDITVPFLLGAMSLGFGFTAFF